MEYYLLYLEQTLLSYCCSCCYSYTEHYSYHHGLIYFYLFYQSKPCYIYPPLYCYRINVSYWMGIAVQYHWILDESVLYWASLKDEPNTSKMSPMCSDIANELLYIIHHAPMVIHLWSVCSSSHPISLDIGWFAL